MASNVYRGLTIEIDGKTDKLTAALSRVNGEVKTANNSLAGLNRALKIDPGNLTLMGDKVKAAGSKVDATKERVDSLTQAQQRLAASGDTDSAAYQRLGKDIATSQVYLDKYSKELGQARVEYSAQESALGRLGTRLTEVGETLEPIGQRAETIGRALTGTLTVGAVSASVAATNLALSFDTAMSQLAGALGEPVDELGDLRELAIQTGQDTIYSAQESAGAMVELAKGGLTEADIAGGALASTMDLAAAGSLGLSDAANTVVQTMGAFHLGADEVGVAVNALAGGANASSADVGELTQALSQVSAVAYGAGWSISDTVAALAAFADAGIKGSDAGTSLKSMLSKLEGPSNAAAEAMDAYGISLYEADGSMKSVGEVADNLKEGLSGLSNEERNAALTTIFGSDAVRAANVLYNEGSEGLAKYTDATEDQTSAQTMANAQLGEGQRAIEDAKGAIETAGIKLGENFAPIVAKAADAVGDAAEQFGNLDSQAQVAVVGVAALAGPVTTVAGKVLKGTKQIGKGLTSAAKFFAKLGGAADAATDSELASATAMGVVKAGAIGLAVAGIALLISKIQDYTKKQEEFTKATEGLTDAAKGSKELKNYSGNLKEVGDNAKSSAKSIDDLISYLGDSADSINQTNQDAKAQIDTLTSARDIIDKYVGMTDLSTSAQGQLQWAIQQVNDQFGTNISLADAVNGSYTDQNGAVQDLKQSIDQLVASKEAEIKETAIESDLTEAYKDQNEAARTLAQAKDDYKNKEDSLIKTEMQYAGLTYDQAKANVDNALAHDSVTDSLDKAQTAYDGATKDVQTYTDELGETVAAADDSADAYTKWASTLSAADQAVLEQHGTSFSSLSDDLRDLGANTDDLSNLSSDDMAKLADDYDGTKASIVGDLESMGVKMSDTAEQTSKDVAYMSSAIQSLSDNGSIDLSKVGMTADDFAAKLQDAGVSADELKSVGSNAFSMLYQSANGDVTKIKAGLDLLNATKIDAKHFTVSDDGTITDEGGKVWNLDQQTIDGKHFTVNDDGTISIENTNVDHLDANQVAQKNFVITDNGTAQESAAEVKAVDRLKIADKNFSVNVSDHASYVINNIKQLADSLHNKEINITTYRREVYTTMHDTANAAGGIRTHADGGIRYHASGYIATKAQFLPRDVVGEDGAEAIIPLTNRHYVRPFARAVAEEMSSMMPRSAQATLAQQASMAEAIGKALSGTTASGASQTTVTISAPTKIVAADEDVYVARTISDRALMSTVASYL